MNSGMPDPETYPKNPRSTRKKWYAVIIVLILLLSSFIVLSALHTTQISPDVSVNTAPNYLYAGDNYTLSLKANEPYKTLTVYWGDNNQTILNYTSNTVTISHLYSSPGIYYIYYKANFTSGSKNFNIYIPVYVESLSNGNRTSNGMITIMKTSSPPVISSSNIFFGNTTANINTSNSGCPANSTFKILSQMLYIYTNGTLNRTMNVTVSGVDYNLTLFSGYYTLKLAIVTGNGTENYTTYYYMDIPVNPHAKVYINTVSDSIVMDSLTPYTNLNPQEAYSRADLEILYNTEQLLIGKGNSSYFPEIASSLPAKGNGINGNNYTFNISNNVKFQNGKPVTAYDVYYSLLMDIMLENKEPQTPGWILAQYLLPGNYHDTMNYTNIMKAITYSNTTNTITLNFTENINSDTVFNILSSPGTFISSASYLKSMGENLTFSQSGFKYFENRSNNYVMNSTFADGPYEVASYIPGHYITLVRNPYFKGTSNYSVPTINSVTITYKSQISSIYQDMRFNTSQIALFPETYPYISYITGVKPYNDTYNLSVMYDFNSNVNISALDKYVAGANLPKNLFSNITVREAFWYAYPGHNTTKAMELWKSFISNKTEINKFNLTVTPSVLTYRYKPLVIPLFTTPLVSGLNLSEFETNLEKMAGTGNITFPIEVVPVSFMQQYEKAGANLMPVYETTIPETTNLSLYYNELGNTMNYTYSYNNGFSYYLYNISNRSQSVLMNELNNNLSKLAANYNETNIRNVSSLLNGTYMYINASRSITMKLYMQDYIIPGYGAVNSYGIVLFNRISL
ncbi:ABC transporter substrate-binding protein [Ferroplasma sp.]|uniref:ABC transporter substrate-binding protein n=1 Tax=Ferroplasma sp. TaxID=2591003 RepID=UPI00307E9A64